MMEERGLSVSDLDAGEETEEEEEEVPFSLVERSNRLDRTLGRKGVAKFFSSVGKGIVKVGKAVGIAISLGFVVGATMEIGLSVGVGISAGIACGVNSRTGGSCVFSIGVGITASAAIPDATCIFGASIFGTFKCGKSFGLTLKIMCCNINLVTGCSSCGKGCSDSSTGASNAAATNAVNKR